MKLEKLVAQFSKEVGIDKANILIMMLGAILLGRRAFVLGNAEPGADETKDEGRTTKVRNVGGRRSSFVQNFLFVYGWIIVYLCLESCLFIYGCIVVDLWLG